MSVKKGEKAVYIFAPYLKKEKVSDDDNRVNGADIEETESSASRSLPSV